MYVLTVYSAFNLETPNLNALKNHDHDLPIEGEILTNPQDIAEGFNDYFAKIGPNLASKIGTSNCNFENYIKKTKSEFAAFQPTTISNVCHLLSGFLAIKLLALIKFPVKL